MKTLGPIGLEKILLFCGFSFALTVVGFWQFQHHAQQSEKLARVQSGVGTCFSRVTQSFTAAMIKEFTSPYLKRDFMALSDDCLREGTKAAGLDLTSFTKTDKIFNELVSEVFWFHEKVAKVLGAAGAKVDVPMQAITEKYSKVEGLKLDLQDQLEIIGGQFREARMRDQILVAISFVMFIASLVMLGLRELASLRLKRAIERQALSLLNTGHAQTGGMVDQLVNRALGGQGMKVTAQVFADYHAGILERQAVRSQRPRSEEIEAPAPEEAEVVSTAAPAPATIAPEPEVDARKLLTGQAVRLKATMDVQDASVQADADVVAQLMHTLGQRFASGKVNLVGKREGERYVICVEASDVCLTASELNYIQGNTTKMDGVDVNVVIAMDLIREAHIDAVIRNRINAEGTIIGAEAVLSFLTTANRSLVTVVRGKKKDLARTLAPSLFN